MKTNYSCITRAGGQRPINLEEKAREKARLPDFQLSVRELANRWQICEADAIWEGKNQAGSRRN